jgi:hypothetical protein
MRMNNKSDISNANGAEGLRTRGAVSTRSAEKKHRASFLLVDLFLLLGVIAVIFLLVLAFTPLDLFGNDTEPREILYTVEFYGVDKDMESAFHEGDAVTDMETGAEMGVVTQVSSRVYEAYTDTPTDEIVPEFDKHVVQIVAVALESSLGGKGTEVVGNLFLVIRGVRNGAEVFEKAEDRRRFAVLNEIGHNDFPFGNG